MDAEGNIIPIVEDDQGEGFKDPLEDPLENPPETKRQKLIRKLEKAYDQAEGKLLDQARILKRAKRLERR